MFVVLFVWFAVACGSDADVDCCLSAYDACRFVVNQMVRRLLVQVFIGQVAGIWLDNLAFAVFFGFDLVIVVVFARCDGGVVHLKLDCLCVCFSIQVLRLLLAVRSSARHHKLGVT